MYEPEVGAGLVSIKFKYHKTTHKASPGSDEPLSKVEKELSLQELPEVPMLSTQAESSSCLDLPSWFLRLELSLVPSAEIIVDGHGLYIIEEGGTPDAPKQICPAGPAASADVTRDWNAVHRVAQ